MKSLVRKIHHGGQDVQAQGLVCKTDACVCVFVRASVCVGRLLAWNGSDRKCVTYDQTEAKVEIREIPAARKATQAKRKKKPNP